MPENGGWGKRRKSGKGLRYIASSYKTRHGDAMYNTGNIVNDIVIPL